MLLGTLSQGKTISCGVGVWCSGKAHAKLQQALSAGLRITHKIILCSVMFSFVNSCFSPRK